MSSPTSRWHRRTPIAAVAAVAAILPPSACVSKLDKLEPSVTTPPSPTTGHTTSTTNTTNTSSSVSSEISSSSSEASSSLQISSVPAGSEPIETSEPDETVATSDVVSSSSFAVVPASSVDGNASDLPSTSNSADATPSAPSTSNDDSTNPAAVPTFFVAGDGLLVWFDAADDSSFVEGAAVAAWSDRSGNENHLGQAVSSGQPTRVADAIGGLPAVRFDGSNDTLASARTLTNRAFHGFVVWRSTRVPPSTKSTLIANSRNFELNHGHISETARAAVSACVGTNCYTSNSGWYDAKFEKGAAVDIGYLWQFSFNDVSADLIAEAWGGLPVTQANPTELPVAAVAPLYVGNCDAANCGFLGDIGEIVLFDRPLTESEQTRSVTYLSAKWSLSEPSH